MNILNAFIFLQYKFHHRSSTGLYISLWKYWDFQSEAKVEQTWSRLLQRIAFLVQVMWLTWQCHVKAQSYQNKLNLEKCKYMAKLIWKLRSNILMLVIQWNWVKRCSMLLCCSLNKGYVWYILITLSLKKSAFEASIKVYFTSKALFVLEISKF